MRLEHAGWDALPPGKLRLVDEHERGWAQLLPLRLNTQAEGP